MQISGYEDLLTPSAAHEPPDGDADWVKLIYTLISNPSLPEDLRLAPALQENPDFKKLYDCIMDIRTLSASLSRGDLQQFVYAKGFILSNLKALQSNLRHLTWQTKKVAEGDFSQRVDFLGEFSDAFNEMTVKLRDSSTQLTSLANIDTLTKIPNRRALEQFLSNSFQDALENQKAYSIIIFDIDFFKAVNDAFGHDAGDIVLIKVSEILNKQFRANDIFSRYGGEEFMAALPGAVGSAAEKIAQRARKAVEDATISLNGKDVNVTISAGISEIIQGDTNFTDIIKRSDQALYEAKNTGRNKVCVSAGDVYPPQA
ncbi:MAG: GGDEF domain-containing protein [Spirochaetales bacterium]|jgi:diguanylate cyclase (GGDEF)-like protein|nr:GGDEF domain-containing protein [Spirochaetales bacterium]